MTILFIFYIFIICMLYFNQEEIIKIWKHKKYVIEIGLIYYNKYYIPMYIHDIDKIFLLCFFPKKISSYLHKKLAFHHFSNIFKIRFYKEMILDWESGRFSKTNKKLTATEWLTMLKEKEELATNFFSLNYNINEKDVEELDKIFLKLGDKTTKISLHYFKNML